MSRESEEKAKKAFEEEVMTKASKAFDWDKEKDPDMKRKRTKTGMKHLDKILSKTNLVISFTLIILFKTYLDFTVELTSVPKTLLS